MVIIGTLQSLIFSTSLTRTLSQTKVIFILGYDGATVTQGYEVIRLVVIKELN